MDCTGATSLRVKRVMVPPYNWGAGSDGMLWQAETGMYFRLATGYLPFAPEGFYDWPIVTSSLQRVALTDVADQWMAFVEPTT
jgi:hypothetical protein